MNKIKTALSKINLSTNTKVVLGTAAGFVIAGVLVDRLNAGRVRPVLVDNLVINTPTTPPAV